MRNVGRDSIALNCKSGRPGSRKMRIDRTLVSVLLFSLLLIATGCGSSKSSDSLVAPTLTTPVVTGLWITASSGPNAVAKWGNPEDASASGGGFEFDASRGSLNGTDSVQQIPRSTAFYNPFPNPAPGAIAILFSLSRNSAVDLWIVKAQWAGDNPSSIATAAGATTIAPQRSTVAVLLHNEIMTAGLHQYIWSDSLAHGFYRVYFRADGATAFHDILIARQASDIPVSLREFLAK